MTVRWGFLGAGWITHAATAGALHSAQRTTLAGVAARDTDRAAALEPERVYGEYNDLLLDDSVDAVYIALANHQHEEWIHKALLAGKHVLCEKPLTLSTATTQAAYREADRQGLLLVEAAWSMWHPRMQRIFELVQGGAIGDVHEFLGTFTFTGVPEGNYRLNPSMGGGALLDIGVYPLHSLVQLLSDTSDVTTSTDRSVGGLGVDLTTRARLTLPGGVTASVVASFEMPESQRLLVRGSGGEISVQDDQAFTSWKVPTSLLVNGAIENFEPVDAYQVMFEAVTNRILGETAWVVTPQSSVRVAQLVDELR